MVGTASALDDLVSILAADGEWRPAYSAACRALREDPHAGTHPAVAAALAEIEAYKGWSGRLRAMRQVIRSHAGKADTEPPHVHIDTGSGLTTALRDHGYAEAPDGLRIPAGYSLANGGIAHEDGIVSHRPIAIVGRAIDVETGDGQVTLAWQYDGQWREATVPRTTVADARAIVSLALRCAPVDSGTSRQLIAWLRDQEHAAVGLPSRVSMSRLGWTPDSTGFLLGEQSIGADVVGQPPDDGDRKHAAGYVVEGTEAGWLEHVWSMMRDQNGALVMLAAFATPLLVPLGAPGWTLDLGASTTKGKTSSMIAAASIYGDPSKIIVPWPSTWAGARGCVTFRHSVPTFFDDTKHLDGNWQTAKRVVYAAADQQSQVMGSITGGTRGSRAVKTIMISSGESPLIVHCGDARGAAARMIACRDRLMDGGMRELRDNAAAYHGAIGLRWVRYLHDRRKLWPAWRRSYAMYCEQAISDGADEVSARVSGYVAQLRITSTLLQRGLGLDMPDGVVEYAASLAEQGGTHRDTPRLAWDCVMAYGSARPSQWEGAHHSREPHLGRQETGWTAWYPGALADAMRDGGYEMSDVLPSWRDRGWLEVNEVGRLTKKVKVEAGKRRMHVLRHGPDGEPLA